MDDRGIALLTLTLQVLARELRDERALGLVLDETGAWLGWGSEEQAAIAAVMRVIAKHRVRGLLPRGDEPL